MQLKTFARAELLILANTEILFAAGTGQLLGAQAVGHDGIDIRRAIWQGRGGCGESRRREGKLESSCGSRRVGLGLDVSSNEQATAEEADQIERVARCRSSIASGCWIEASVVAIFRKAVCAA
jgi:hypothetical protein